MLFITFRYSCSMDYWGPDGESAGLDLWRVQMRISHSDPHFLKTLIQETNPSSPPPASSRMRSTALLQDPPIFVIYPWFPSLDDLQLFHAGMPILIEQTFLESRD